MGRVDDKVALISGGARGMGAADARMLVAEGAKVVIGDILDEQGAALAEELGEAARYVHLDVTSADDWKSAVDTAVQNFGKLNVLVNNAGIAQAAPLKTVDMTRWQKVLDVNLTGPMLGIKAVIEPMIASMRTSTLSSMPELAIAALAFFMPACTPASEPTGMFGSMPPCHRAQFPLTSGVFTARRTRSS